MSYTIIRNDKLTRVDAQGSYIHNDRRSKGHSNKDIDKICCRDFWKGRDSYRQLQNAFHKYITSKGFDLERGLPVEETGAKHENLKKLTNFENTKKVLDNIKLELPETPDINYIKLIKLNKEKVENEIIKPRDDKIMELYQENLKLHNELSKQVNLVNMAEKCQKERNSILTDNRELHNQVDNVKAKYKKKEFDIEWKYKSKIKNLEKEITHLHKIIDKFYETVDKFIVWICHKFGIGESKELVKKFEEETRSFIDPVKQIKHEEREKEWVLER